MSCNTTEKKFSSSTKPDTPKDIDILEPDLDTLPNGKRHLNNVDSSLSMYYKEVVGPDTLKGGYITCYGIDDTTKYFYLRHDDTLHLLNHIPIYTSTWSLGIVEKDFDNFFITTVDNGNGVPQTYQVFDKRTGKNLLGDKVEAWGFQYLGNTLFFLYDNHSVELTDHSINRQEADSIFLYNVKSGKRQGFALPKENPEDIIYYNIKNLTKHSLTISRQEHSADKENMVKYSR
jgi:hypothetical protein